MEWGLHQGKGLDTDMTDEAAWQARPEFAAKSAARMAKDAKALTRANTANAKSLQAASHTVLDTDHTDEEAWQARKELRKQSKARKKAEAKALAAKNRAIFKKISSTTTSDKLDDDLTGAGQLLTRTGRSVPPHSHLSYYLRVPTTLRVLSWSDRR